MGFPQPLILFLFLNFWPWFTLSFEIVQAVAKKRVIQHKINSLKARRKLATKSLKVADEMVSLGSLDAK